MDGVDVAYVETDGDGGLSFGPVGFYPYCDADRALLRAALADAAALEQRDLRPGVLPEAERMVTDRHAEAVETFLKDEAIDPAGLSVIGFHGQTVLHRPKSRLTVQIGDGPALAARLGVDVAHDFRGADIAAGGEGAPIVPVFHRALVAAAGLGGEVALLNTDVLAVEFVINKKSFAFATLGGVLVVNHMFNAPLTENNRLLVVKSTFAGTLTR